eukprot:268262_1
MADYEHEGVIMAYNIFKGLPFALFFLLFAWSKFLHRLPAKYIPVPTEIMPEKTEDWFFSPPAVSDSQKLPAIAPTVVLGSDLVGDNIYYDDDDDYDERQILALPSKASMLQEDDSMWDEKDQEPMMLLGAPPDARRLRTMNRDKSDMSDFGVSMDVISDIDDIAIDKRRQRTVSKRGSLYTSVSQDNLKSTRL